MSLEIEDIQSPAGACSSVLNMLFRRSYCQICQSCSNAQSPRDLGIVFQCPLINIDPFHQCCPTSGLRLKTREIGLIALASRFLQLSGFELFVLKTNFMIPKKFHSPSKVQTSNRRAQRMRVRKKHSALWMLRAKSDLIREP